MNSPLRIGKKVRGPVTFSGRWRFHLGIFWILLLSAASPCFSWTIQDYNPWKQLREWRIFSLTRANPIGTRILVIPVLDEPVNTPVYTRVCTEFTNQLRSFASEVWLITDLPEGPVKQGFYAGLSQILADYRLKNRLSMDLISAMIPDFECDFIALFEVTSYDRYWIDHDLQHRVALRCVLYDYEDGGPRIEKYFAGGRGRRLEEGAFSEAERIAVKGLIEELERPLRKSIEERELELQRRYAEINELAVMTNQKEWAIHQYDLGLMAGQIAANRDKAAKAEWDKTQIERERDYWRQQAETSKETIEQYQTQLSQTPGQPAAVRTPIMGRPYRGGSFFAPRFQFPCPPGAAIPNRISPPATAIPIAPEPAPAPPRMPTLQPIDFRGAAPASPDAHGKTSPSTIAFRDFDELPEYELKSGSILTPPWEKEPRGEWEYVEPEP